MPAISEEVYDPASEAENGSLPRTSAALRTEELGKQWKITRFETTPPVCSDVSVQALH